MRYYIVYILELEKLYITYSMLGNHVKFKWNEKRHMGHASYLGEKKKFLYNMCEFYVRCVVPNKTATMDNKMHTTRVVNLLLCTLWTHLDCFLD